MKIDAIIERLKSESDGGELEGMARVGITPERAFGTRLAALRKLAREVGKDHALARELWEAGYRETRILAAMVEESRKVTGEKKVAGSWNGIRFWSPSGTLTMLDYITIEYGGDYPYQPANLALMEDSFATVTNSTIAQSGGYGFWVAKNASLSQSNNTVTVCSSGELYQEPPWPGCHTRPVPEGDACLLCSR